MEAMRNFWRDRCRLAAVLVVLVLAVKALVPAGYMPGTGARVLTVLICADASGMAMTRQIVVPGAPATFAGESGDDLAGKAKGDGLCAFSALGLGSAAPAGPVLLALALAFILALGLAPVRAEPRPTVRLRPPLRAPPIRI